MLAIQLSHPVYDCMYLALALRRRMQVVSADRRFVSVVRRHPQFSTAVVLLAAMAH